MVGKKKLSNICSRLLLTVFTLFCLSSVANSAVVSIHKLGDADESGTSGEFEVRLSSPAAGDTAFTYFVTGNATPGTDYTPLANSVTISDTYSSAIITVTPNIVDDLIEIDEEVIVTLDIPGGPHTRDAVDYSETVYIVDDDEAELSINPVSQDEDSGDMIFTVTASKTVAANAEVTFQYATSDVGGEAVAGTDYTATSGPALIKDGTTTTITVPVTNDSGNPVVERDEVFEITLSSPSANVVSPIANDTAQGTINNDDRPTISITDSTVDELDGSSLASGMEISSNMDIAADAEVKFTYTLVHGTTDNNDFASPPTAPVNYTISGGVSANTPFVSILDIAGDTLVEYDESYTVQLSGGSIVGGSGGPPVTTDTGSGTIRNNDQPEITITTTSTSTGNEGDSGDTSNALFAVESNLAIASGVLLNFDYTVDVGGSATAEASDVTTGPFSTSLGNGTNSVDIAAVITGDDIIEPDETYSVTIYNVAFAGSSTVPPILGGADTAVGTITNDDYADFSIVDVTELEDTGTITLVIDAGKTVEDTNVSVQFDTSDGSAKAGATEDYIATTGTATISSGSTFSFPVTLVVDDIVEENEFFNVNLSNPSAGANFSAVPGKVTIEADETPELSLSPSTVSTTEGATGDTSTATYTVQSDLLVAPDASIDVNFLINSISTTAGDLSAAPVSISGGNTVDILVEIQGDDIVEGDEIYEVVVTGGNVPNSGAVVSVDNANDTATGTIINDDIPILTINDPSVYEGKTGSTDSGFLVTTTLEVAPDATVSATWDVGHGATDNLDFTSTTGTVSFSGGISAGASIPLGLLIAADFDVEVDEDYTVTLSNATISADTDAVPTTSDVGNGEILNDEHNVLVTYGPDGVIKYGGTTVPTGTDVVIDRNAQPVFTVEADNCYHVDDITAEGSTSSAYGNTDDIIPYTFTALTQNRTIDANFAIDRWTVTSNILADSHGTITATNTFDGCTNPAYAVTSDSGYHISDIEVDGTPVVSNGPTFGPGDANHTQLFNNINDNHTITAAFTQIIEIIEDSPFGEITEDPDPGNPSYLEVAHDSSPTFEILSANQCPNSHTHHISNILIDGVPTGIRGTNTVDISAFPLANVTADTTIEVQFTGVVDVTFNGLGSLELGSQVVNGGSGIIEYESDIAQTIKIIPAVGYHIGNVKVDNVSVGRVSEYTFNEKTPQDHKIEVDFAIDWYSLEATSTYNTVYDDSNESIVATVEYPTFGHNHSYYVDLNDPLHYIQAIFIDNVKVNIPAANATYSDPAATYRLVNTGDDTLEVQFTNIRASHRLVVVDYDQAAISDVPLVASSISAPANIMFIIDDSGSMSWSTLVPGVEQGKYCDGGTGIYCNGGNTYTSILEPGGQIAESAKMQWKSQWYKYNRMYYNPSVNYVPWPRVVQVSQNVGDSRTHADADTSQPRFHPLDASRLLNLSATFTSLAQPGSTTQKIDDGQAGFTSFGYTRTTSGNANNGDYWYADGTDPSKWAQYSFITPQTGDYEVYISWSNSNSARVKVDYTITSSSSGINDIVSVDQANDGWSYGGDPPHLLNPSPIGPYSLTANETLTVRLEDREASSSTSSVDAVMLTSGRVRIPNAHYYIWSSTDSVPSPYLVIFDDTTAPKSIRYFKVTGTSIDSNLDNSDDEVTALAERTGSAIPTDVLVAETYSEALQNFANWVTYYRERRCAAVAGVSRALVEMEGVNVGLSPLWTASVNDVVPVKKIKVDGQDYTDDILEVLYDWPASGGTPLRDALEEVGQYFENSDTNDWSQGLPSPYASEQDGGACQQCFAILMTDGYYNGNSNAFGNYNDDNDNTSFIDTGGDYLYASPHNNTLADIAMHFYENDLVGTLADIVATSPEETETFHDIADWQHMVTYTVSFGLSGTLNPADYELRTTASTPNYPDWPDPQNNQPTTVDDLWHAAVNGRGKFLSATNPDELVQSLLAIMENIAKRTGSGASVSINGDPSYETLSSDIRMYQTSFNTTSWYGDLKSYKLVSSAAEASNDTDDNGVYDTSEWSASTQMMARSSYTSRDLFTFNGGGVTLDWANLSALQQKALRPYYLFPLGPGTHPVNLDELTLEYLKGDSSLEGNYFRSRAEPLGDFVNSRAEYEDDVLYVGGNDGMLHAFDALNGEELFAYIPGLVYSELRELGNPGYDHKFYVDSTPAVNRFDSSLTLLVGGLGKGGKGYYGLDVTDPAAFSAADVLWEYPAPPAVLLSDKTTITFVNPGTGNDIIRDTANGLAAGDFTAGKYITVIGADCATGYTNNGTYKIVQWNSTGEIEISGGSLINGCGNGQSVTITDSISDPGMGYSFSEPIIVETSDTSIGSGVQKGYAVIFGNGYASEDGTAQLYILNPADGSLIRKIDTGVGPTNGLSKPVVTDVNNDRRADYVYAGDLLGNMWKFDLTSNNSADWQVAYCDGGDQASHCNAVGATPKPLFKGKSFQPITAAPDVMIHPSGVGYMVIYGTGQFLGQPDLESSYLQSMYGLWDWAPDEYDIGYLGERTDSLEDIDGDGRLDVDEDLNNNGLLDIDEDLDGDGNLDVNEDTNGNGILDVGEDVDGDLKLDLVDEDLNGNGLLDVDEDLDGDGHLDVDEDTYPFNGKIDALSPTLLSNSPKRDASNNPMNTLLRQEVLVEGDISEDADGDGNLDVDEDTNNNGILDGSEDLDGDTRLDVDEDRNNNGTIDVYSYYRMTTFNKPTWTTAPTIDVNFDGFLDSKDKVPQANLGWYFDLPGRLTDNDNTDNDGDGVVDESGERSVGERVTSDAIIREGKAIMVSYGVSGTVCDVGMFSFLNERDAATGGGFFRPVIDLNGDGLVNQEDMTYVFTSGQFYLLGVTDVGGDGRMFNPAIVRDERNPDGPVEHKFKATSLHKVIKTTEEAERRGIYYWQQIE